MPAGFLPVLVTVAALLMIPIILFTVAGFQVSLTLLLAPVAGLSLFYAPTVLRNLFIGAFVAGLISVAVAPVVLGDAFQPRSLLSLVLMMTSPLYFFLGWHLCARFVTFRRLLETLGVVATVFVLALALETIITGSQVRWYMGRAGFTVLNVDFFGLPLYGSYGVLSLTSLLVLQTFVIGAAFIASTVPWRQVALLIGFAAAAFLVMGSNARGPQLVLPCLFVLLGATALFQRGAIRGRAAMLLAAGLLSIAYSSARMVEPNRLIATVRELLPPPAAAGAGAPEGRVAAVSSNESSAPNGRVAAVPDLEDLPPVDLESLSTGRASLLQDSLGEVAASPIVGNGFGSFGRVNRQIEERYGRTLNRTAHLHYLTVLWKGGVLFFVPYMALLGAFWLRAIRGLLPGRRPEVLILGAGVVSLFTILSLTWDILLVPSAGALGFFLLGALTQSGSGDPRPSMGPGEEPQPR
jgi:hypothetical protein